MNFGSYPSRGRGGYAPRRGRGGKSAAMFRKDNGIKPDIVKHPLGKHLVTLSNSDLEPTRSGPVDNAVIENCNYVGSYSWMNTKSPTILVPGKPPRWTPLEEPRRLEEDSGIYFRDSNAAHFSEYPTEASVQALFKKDSDFPTGEIDIFGCNSTFGNLLRFVRSIDKSFRFSIEVISNTVFFVRKENDPKEIIEGVRGFGHTFPEAYTTWDSDVRGSESHQRLMRYELGGLNCVIRFGCDGYIGNRTKFPSGDNDASNLKTKHTVDDLLQSFGSAAVVSNIPNSDESITIRTGGSAPSQETIFDLKTRSGRFKRDIDLEEIYPVLWLEQVPNFIIAYHDGAGLFEDVRVQDIRQGVRDWEDRNKTALHRLIILLKKIIAVSHQSDTKLLEIYSPSVNHLEIRKQHGEGSHALPSDLRAKWEKAQDTFSDAFDSPYNLWNHDNEDDFESKFSDSDEEELDFTACSADDCGYCGKCTY